MKLITRFMLALGSTNPLGGNIQAQDAPSVTLFMPNPANLISPLLFPF